MIVWPFLNIELFWYVILKEKKNDFFCVCFSIVDIKFPHSILSIFNHIYKSDFHFSIIFFFVRCFVIPIAVLFISLDQLTELCAVGRQSKFLSLVPSIHRKWLLCVWSEYPINDSHTFAYHIAQLFQFLISVSNGMVK